MRGSLRDAATVALGRIDALGIIGDVVRCHLFRHNLPQVPVIRHGLTLGLVEVDAGEGLAGRIARDNYFRPTATCQ